METGKRSPSKLLARGNLIVSCEAPVSGSGIFCATGVDDQSLAGGTAVSIGGGGAWMYVCDYSAI